MDLSLIPKLRRRACRAQDGLCFYCRLQMTNPTAEHLIPRQHGGPTTASNIVAACRRCNERRHADPRCRPMTVDEYATLVLLEHQAGISASTTG
ncbi:HNH endonuclease [Variovorax ginsengisoli]|uniref:HNH endonuclease n=1 Tax=Variovorax ginsengisoli TaxID=363844 RepID=UPI0034527EED